jgi:peptidoglycan/xylan/chitin deacetylase (PgdA/CDA1 family)
MRGRSLILAFHNVVPDELAGRGDRSLHLPVGRFRRQLDLIEAHCRVVPLAELLAGASAEKSPVVAITFDDAYRGAIELAFPEMVRRGLPSTLFVAPGLLGCASFWWDELADPMGGLSPEVRKAALEVRAGNRLAIRAEMSGDRTEPLLPACYGCASESQLQSLVAKESVTLGSHSWSHPNLTRIAPDELERELARPLEWLGSVNGPTLPVLAYPYGLASPAVESAARHAGYTEALLVEGGWITPGGGPWAIPRYNVSAGLSEDGLLLRLSGVLDASSSRTGG